MTEQNPETPDIEPEQQIETEEQQAAEEEVVYSSGSLLKQAREDLGISIEELAEQIRVPLNVLEAIEIDKVPKNLPETFIRGYIRSYARKVNVDEALVLPEVETVAAINQTTSQSNYTDGTTSMSLAQWAIENTVSQSSDTEAVVVDRSSGAMKRIRRV